MLYYKNLGITMKNKQIHCAIGLSAINHVYILKDESKFHIYFSFSVRFFGDGSQEKASG